MPQLESSWEHSVSRLKKTDTTSKKPTIHNSRNVLCDTSPSFVSLFLSVLIRGCFSSSCYLHPCSGHLLHVSKYVCTSCCVVELRILPCLIIAFDLFVLHVFVFLAILGRRVCCTLVSGTLAFAYFELNSLLFSFGLSLFHIHYNSLVVFTLRGRSGLIIILYMVCFFFHIIYI